MNSACPVSLCMYEWQRRGFVYHTNTEANVNSRWFSASASHYMINLNHQIKSNQIKSNQIKSLLLSHHHSTSALVSEILMSVLQTVQKKQQQQFTYGQTVQKNNKQFTYWHSAKKQQQQFTYGQTVQKNNKQFTYGQTVQRKQQTIYIWTVHIYRLYRRQCAKYTYIYSVHIVYYKDTLNYQRHIIHRMGTSTLCTLSIHNVVYT